MDSEKLKKVNSFGEMMIATRHGNTTVKKGEDVYKRQVWTIADIFNGLMALPNMIALFALSGVVVKETKHFFERHRCV